MPSREHETASQQQNSWSEYRRLVTKGLEDLDCDIKDLNGKFDKMQIQFTKDITELQTKAGMWGGVIGAVCGAIASFVVQLIFKKP